MGDDAEGSLKRLLLFVLSGGCLGIVLFLAGLSFVLRESKRRREEEAKKAALRKEADERAARPTPKR